VDECKPLVPGAAAALGTGIGKAIDTLAAGIDPGGGKSTRKSRFSLSGAGAGGGNDSATRVGPGLGFRF
jgi:hypothetical protein